MPPLTTLRAGRERYKSCLLPPAPSHGAVRATAMGTWPCFRSRGTVRRAPTPTRALGGTHASSGVTHTCTGWCRLCRPPRSRSAPGSFAPVPVRGWGAAQPWPQQRERDLPGENPTTGLEKPRLDPPHWARGEALAGGANDAKRTSYLGTRQRGESSFCEFCGCGSDGDSKAVYPRELSPGWRCWVNGQWPPTDPPAASASGARRWQRPGSTSPKWRPFKTPLRKATAEVTQESAAQPHPAWRTSPFTLLGFHPSSFAFSCCHFLWLFKLGTLVAIIHFPVSYQPHSEGLQLSINKYHTSALAI